MSVVTRLTRLLQADLHAMLDHMEAPEVLLKQAIREMEAELMLLRKALDAKSNQRLQLEQQRKQLVDGLQQHDVELALCLQHDNDALARNLLRKKLAADMQAARLQQQIARLKQELEHDGAGLQQQQTELEQLQQQAQWIVQASVVSQGDALTAEGMITEADIELALLKAKSERGGL